MAIVSHIYASQAARPHASIFGQFKTFLSLLWKYVFFVFHYVTVDPRSTTSTHDPHHLWLQWSGPLMHFPDVSAACGLIVLKRIAVLTITWNKAGNKDWLIDWSSLPGWRRIMSLSLLQSSDIDYIVHHRIWTFKKCMSRLEVIDTFNCDCNCKSRQTIESWCKNIVYSYAHHSFMFV